MIRTWALLRWCSTKRRYIKCTYLYLLPFTRILDFIGAKDDGSGGDNWSSKTCKATVESSPPTNQRPVFTGRMPFLSPNQQCHSSEGGNVCMVINGEWKHHLVNTDKLQWCCRHFETHLSHVLDRKSIPKPVILQVSMCSKMGDLSHTTPAMQTAYSSTEHLIWIQIHPFRHSYLNINSNNSNLNTVKPGLFSIRKNTRLEAATPVYKVITVQYSQYTAVNIRSSRISLYPPLLVQYPGSRWLCPRLVCRFYQGVRQSGS